MLHARTCLLAILKLLNLVTCWPPSCTRAQSDMSYNLLSQIVWSCINEVSELSHAKWIAHLAHLTGALVHVPSRSALCALSKFTTHKGTDKGFIDQSFHLSCQTSQSHSISYQLKASERIVWLDIWLTGSDCMDDLLGSHYTNLDSANKRPFHVWGNGQILAKSFFTVNLEANEVASPLDLNLELCVFKTSSFNICSVTCVTIQVYFMPPFNVCKKGLVQVQNHVEHYDYLDCIKTTSPTFPL